jgi:hypothetical protein
MSKPEVATADQCNLIATGFEGKLGKRFLAGVKTMTLGPPLPQVGQGARNWFLSSGHFSPSNWLPARWSSAPEI